MIRSATYPSLEDRVVFVTGGGSGIGAVHRRALLRPAGSRGVRGHRRSRPRRRSATARRAGSRPPSFIPCDLRDIAALRRPSGAWRARLGPIRVLVNNAAHDERHTIEGVTPEYWDDRFAVNLRHQFFAAQACRRRWRRRAAARSSISARSWMVGQGGIPAYLSAKSAVVGLTRALARDSGPEHPRQLGRARLDHDRAADRAVAHAGGRAGAASRSQAQALPADVARVVLFLAADDSAGCTAQNYLVDAGWV